MTIDRQLWLFSLPSATLPDYQTTPESGREMSELTEGRWAVLSERGCEAMGLTYAQAAEMMRALAREKISGLSVITDMAARRSSHGVSPRTRQPNSNGAGRQAKVKR